MPNLLDLPGEIRNMIYSEALYNDWRLVARKEVSVQQLKRIPEPTAAIALLRVSKQVNAETVPIFFGKNTFSLSLNPALGKPSVFTTQAQRFRKITFSLGGTYAGERTSHASYFDNDVLKLWKAQIRALAPMVNLERLELGCNEFFYILSESDLFHLAHTRESLTGLPPLTGFLLAEVLAPLPQSVRKKEGVPTHGIHVWILGHLYRRTEDEPLLAMHEIGEACREFGLNFMVGGNEQALHPEPSSAH